MRIATTPEASGLCGCWQLVKVRRERQPVGSNPMKPSDEVQYYVTSLLFDESTDEELLALIRDHWSAIENGMHHRRDETFDEDRCRVAHRSAEHALATLRNRHRPSTVVAGTVSAQCPKPGPGGVLGAGHRRCPVRRGT